VQFREFLAARRKRHDATGDFARAALADTALPDFTKWDDLSAYIERLGGYEAVEAGRTVWMEYQDHQRGLARARRV
jgi:uncharacterized protein YozE (UPF0346 family)